MPQGLVLAVNLKSEFSVTLVPAPGAKRPRESSSSTDRVQKELHRIWATPKGAITGWLTIGSRIKRRMKIGAGAIKRGSHSEGFML